MTKLKGTDFILTYLKLYATQCKVASEREAKRVCKEIASLQGWRWMTVIRRVCRGNADKFLKQAVFKEGVKVTFACQDFKQKTISINSTKGYDYPKEFDKMIQELKNALNEDIKANMHG